MYSYYHAKLLIALIFYQKSLATGKIQLVHIWSGSNKAMIRLRIPVSYNMVTDETK